jgi:hypothetical protein
MSFQQKHLELTFVIIEVPEAPVSSSPLAFISSSSLFF